MMIVVASAQGSGLFAGPELSCAFFLEISRRMLDTVIHGLVLLATAVLGVDANGQCVFK